MTRLLRDRYEPLERIGSGGQATVYRAVDRQHERPVALKVRPVEGARSELLHEARVLLDLPPHPNLPLVRDDFFDGDDYYVVMDWIEGENLTQVLARRGPLRAHEAIAHLVDVGEALDHLHAHGIVHGDVKPANIIATPAGRNVLVDLGATPGARLGTLGFRAPELAASAPPIPASDVYGLGATTYALLTGQRPGAGAAWTGLPLPGVLERTIRRAMATDPQARHHAAAALMEELRTWAMGARVQIDGEAIALCILIDAPEGNEHPGSWRSALERATSLAEHAVMRHGGAFEQDGSILTATFAEVTDAIVAAAEIQRTLSKERWPTPEPLGAAIGISAEQQTADQGGRGARARRIAEAGHSGQILMGPAAAEIAQRRLPPGAGLLDLGAHRLRDLHAPRRLFELDAPGIPRGFPPLRSLDSVPNNLPVALTSFVGRSREITELRALLDEHRLVTITGAGGSGKTRLALHLAAEFVDRCPGGIWVLDLAPVSGSTSVLPWMAAILRLHVAPGEDVIEALATSFADAPALVVIDNCEHVVDEVAFIMQRLLEAGATTRAIATGREPLRIPGEAIWRVPSLSAPDAGEHDPAVALFIDRARAAAPSLPITPGTRDVIVDICSRLDGMPLAIELAATAAATMSIDEIRARLNDRFNVLGGGARTALPRQQTLRATIDWSYDGLDEAERTLLRRFSVFRDGASLDAVEGICADDGSAILALSRLVDKSLIAAETLLEGSRYRMIQTVREYASARFEESDEAAIIRARHRDFYLSLSEAAATELRGADQAWWFQALEVEYANIRGAIDRSLSEGEDPVATLRFGAALWRFWWRRHPSEGAALIGEMLARAPDGADPQILIPALIGAGVIETDLGNLVGARDLCERACALARDTRADQHLVTALLALGNVESDRSEQAAARAAYEEALDVARSLDWEDAIAGVLGNLGKTAYYQGDLDAAERYLADSLEIMRRTGDEQATAVALTGLGSTARAKGDLSRARAFHAESLEIYRRLGDDGGVAMALNNLGNVARDEGDNMAARAHHEEALALRRRLGLRHGVVISQLNLTKHAREDGDLASARAYATEALTISRETGYRTGIPRALAELGETARIEGDPVAAAGFFRDGLRAAADIDANDPAITCLIGLATIAVDGGDAAGAIPLLAAARAIGDATNSMDGVLERDLDATLARARDAVGAPAADELLAAEAPASVAEAAARYAD